MFISLNIIIPSSKQNLPTLGPRPLTTDGTLADVGPMLVDFVCCLGFGEFIFQKSIILGVYQSKNIN